MNACTECMLKAGYEQTELVYMQMELQYRFWL